MLMRFGDYILNVDYIQCICKHPRLPNVTCFFLESIEEPFELDVTVDAVWEALGSVNKTTRYLIKK